MRRSVGHEQRFIEPADLKRKELGRWRGHALCEDFPHEIAHPVERDALLGGDLGGGHPGVQKVHDPLFAVGSDSRPLRRATTDRSRRTDGEASGMPDMGIPK